MSSNPWTDVPDVLDFAQDASRRWRPEVGDRIEGKIVERALGADRYGLHRVCVFVDPEGDEHHIWLLHDNLKGEFRREAPRVGDFIVVERLEDRGRRKRYCLSVARCADQHAAASAAGPRRYLR